MKRYHLNARGRFIWIELPLLTAAVLFGATNFAEVLLSWILGY